MSTEFLYNSAFQFPSPVLHDILRDFNATEAWNKKSQGRIQARYISPFAVILYKRLSTVEVEYPKIGKGTWIGHFCIIDGSQDLEIGENCNISCGVQIYTHSTSKRCAYDMPKETAPTKIGNNVFIGPNSVIAMGCEIGDQVVIGALSYISKFSIIPAKHVVEGRFSARRWGKGRDE